MKPLTLILTAIIVFLLIKNIQLRRTIKSKYHYHSNIPRNEMADILLKATGDDIAVFIPGDTSVMPYLIKDKN